MQQDKPMLKKEESDPSRVINDIPIWIIIMDKEDSDPIVSRDVDPVKFLYETTVLSYGDDIESGNLASEDVIGVYLSAKEAVTAVKRYINDTLDESDRIEEKKSQTVSKIQSTINSLEKQRKECMAAAQADPKNATQHRSKLAQLTSKIDELITKMERVEKAKKAIEDPAKVKDDKKVLKETKTKKFVKK